MKLVRIYFVVILICSTSVSLAQDWLVMERQLFNNSLFFQLQTAERTKYFKINPYDGSLWFTSEHKVIRIGNDGEYVEFENEDFPDAPYNNYFAGVEFSPSGVFVLDVVNGLFRFHNNTWTFVMPGVDGTGLDVDQDTVWVVRQEKSILRWKGGQTDQFSYAGLIRVNAKNGKVWGSQSTSAGLCFYQDNQCNGLIPSNSILTDFGNQDFKYLPSSDTLILSYIDGFALAINGEVVDTITLQTMTDFPEGGSILEFEFDADENIWAFIGNRSNNKAMKIAHFNRFTRTWSQVYDANNSPLPFNEFYNMEVDQQDNLWVASSTKLYLLANGSVPSWVGEVLSLEDYEQSPNIQISPNPSSSFVTIQTEGEKGVLRMWDTQSKLIRTHEFFSEEVIDVTELDKGVYFFEVQTTTSRVVRKFIKQ